MKKSTTFRWIFYAGGLLILAMGIILNTKSGLGVSPIISVAYSISTIWNLNFGNTTFGLYTVFVIIELLLHTCHNYRQRREENHALDGVNEEIIAADSGYGPFTAAIKSGIYPFYESVFFLDPGTGTGGDAICCTTLRYHPDGNRSGNVLKYANRAKSGRRNRTGNRRYDPKTGWIYKKLL